MKASFPILAVVLAAGMASTTAAQRETRFEQAARERRALAAAEKAASPRVRGALRDVLHLPAGSSLSGLAAPSGIPTRDGAVAVTIRATDTPKVLALLQARGRTPANTMDGVVEAYLTPADVAQLAADPAVVSIEGIARPRAQAISQGVAAHNADNWHAAGLTGAGVKVGIIDVGFLGISALVGTELPEPAGLRCYLGVGVWEETLAACDTYADHGTAVAESLSDVAPDARLYLATPYSTLDVATSVNWMVSQGVEVINLSVTFIWDGPGDGTSPYPDSPLKSIDAAVAGGSLFVSAAGNAGRSSWLGPWRDTNANHHHEFAVGADGTLHELNEVFLNEGQRLGVDLRWDDSWSAAVRDLDLYLWDPVLEEVVAWSERWQSGQWGATPIEAFEFVAPRTGVFEIAVLRYAGQPPPWLQLLVWTRQALTYRTPFGSIENPAESANPGMLSVGAARWDTPTTLEPFSSLGPTPDGRIKPDVVGADGGDTVSRGPGGFLGTSQAAAHVSGLSALAKGAFPAVSPARLAAYLRHYARPRGGVPNIGWGYGFAALPDVCAYTLTPDTVPVAAGGGEVTVTVTTAPGCGWTASSGAAWLAIQSGAIGDGDGVVTVRAAPNDAGARVGTLTIEGRTVTIVQSGVETLPPSPPRMLAATVRGQDVRLTWLPPLAGAPTGYHLEVGSAPGLANLAAFAFGNTLTFTAAAPNGTYFLRVRASSPAGVSLPSDELVVVVGPAPGPPTGLAAAVNGTTVSLEWNAAATGGPPTGFTVVASLTPGGPPIAAVTVTTPALTVVNVPPGVYHVRVHAMNGAGVSGPSSEVTVTVAGDAVGSP
jgi:hypothetical protein